MIASTVVRLTFVNVRKYGSLGRYSRPLIFVVVAKMRNMLPHFFYYIFFLFYFLFIHLFLYVIIYLFIYLLNELFIYLNSFLSTSMYT